MISYRYYIILILFTIYFINSNVAHSISVPRSVFRATPSKPDKIFANGFERPNSFHTDLARHIYGESGTISGFISTTSSRSYAFDYASSYALGWWNVNSFYVYEIIPDSNFISVTDTYNRTLQNETNPERASILRDRVAHFTNEFEYSALFRIPPERIIAASRYDYDYNTRSFVLNEEEIINTVTRVNRHTPQLTPAIHENTYPLGTISVSQDYQGNSVSISYGCITEHESTISSMRKKRSLNDVKIKCPSQNERPKFNFYDLPTTFIEKNKFKINIKAYNYDLCISHDNEYITFEDCKVAKNWSYTKFGQLISEVFDGKNSQYYCMTSPYKNESQGYAKMEICDLNKKEQIWKPQKTDYKYASLNSFHNFKMHSTYHYYGYMYKNYDAYNAIKVKNHNEFNTRQTQPLIQFSINRFGTNSLTMYPTAHGNVYSNSVANLTGYKNYYNAHNYSIFSSYGNDSRGPQVCYLSQLIKFGSSSWNWVGNDYCSSKGTVNNYFRWIFTSDYNKKNGYNIRDYYENILKIDNVFSSSNRYFAYTSNPYWIDKSSNIKSFDLDESIKVLAKSYSRNHTIELTKEQKLINSYTNLKIYFNKRFDEILFLK